LNLIQIKEIIYYLIRNMFKIIIVTLSLIDIVYAGCC